MFYIERSEYAEKKGYRSYHLTEVPLHLPAPSLVYAKSNKRQIIMVIREHEAPKSLVYVCGIFQACIVGCQQRKS